MYDIKLTMCFIALSLSTKAQEKFIHNTDTLQRKGIIIHQNRFSNRNAILMRDTTLSGNQFNYRWHEGIDIEGRVSQTNYQFPAFLVDSTLASSCDSLFLFDSKNKHIRWTSYPKKGSSTLTKKNIRLYVGYIDEKGQKNIVVQFISLKEFKNGRKIYSRELFLIVPRKNCISQS